MKYAPMWKDGNAYYHYSDKVRAGKNPVLKYVTMDKDYFIGTWQFKENFAIAIYNTEQEAEQAIQ